jgi:hypothetical protein
MTADALKKITSDALDQLAALLDEGHSDQLTALLRTMAQFHKYSWHNVCLIARQRPTATRVAGFRVVAEQAVVRTKSAAPRTSRS